MPSCEEQLAVDWANCDSIYQQEKAACNGDPQCIWEAQQRRYACENKAYLKYIQCISQQSGIGPKAKKPTGSKDCGCGSGGGD